jgi:tRNA (cytosine38-C5)-methyltransferase
LTAEEINKIGPKIVMMSPPCQPFTRVGLKMDVKDPRCSSFLHFLKILPNFKTIEFILMENVVGFENSEMKNAFTETLDRCQFYYREFILSPQCLNIPNSRSRYYLLARKIKDFSFGSQNKIVSIFNKPFCF